MNALNELNKRLTSVDIRVKLILDNNVMSEVINTTVCQHKMTKLRRLLRAKTDREI